MIIISIKMIMITIKNDNNEDNNDDHKLFGTLIIIQLIKKRGQITKYKQRTGMWKVKIG